MKNKTEQQKKIEESGQENEQKQAEVILKQSQKPPNTATNETVMGRDVDLQYCLLRDSCLPPRRKRKEEM